MRMGCLVGGDDYGCSFEDNLGLEGGSSVTAKLGRMERSSLPELLMTGLHE